MNYTEKYHLPQWDETDRIMRVDFNDAMAGIETGMSENAQTAQDAMAEAVKLPYVVGTYVGTGEHDRHIVLGFRPRFVLVGAPAERDSGGSGMDGYGGFTCGGALPNHLKITADGFIVNAPSVSNWPKLNDMGFTYDYIAFR